MRPAPCPGRGWRVKVRERVVQPCKKDDASVNLRICARKLLRSLTVPMGQILVCACLSRYGEDDESKIGRRAADRCSDI